MQYITDIAEPPSGLSIVAVGLNAPVFPSNYTFSGTDAIFTCPRLARLTNTADWTGATATPSASLSGHNLALPLSVLAADAADLNGDGAVRLDRPGSLSCVCDASGRALLTDAAARLQFHD